MTFTWSLTNQSTDVKIVRGNSVNVIVKVTKDGDPVDNLDELDDARFVVEDKDHTYLIDKDITDMQVDTPEEGSVTIPLNSEDTNIPEGVYRMAFQADWTSEDKVEFVFSTKFKVLSGLIE